MRGAAALRIGHAKAWAPCVCVCVRARACVGVGGRQRAGAHGAALSNDRRRSWHPHGGARAEPHSTGRGPATHAVPHVSRARHSRCCVHGQGGRQGARRPCTPCTCVATEQWRHLRPGSPQARGRGALRVACARATLGRLPDAHVAVPSPVIRAGTGGSCALRAPRAAG